MPPRVAIVGRPNVGKSTLFNRLTGRRAALVDDVPGVTRDWLESEALLGALRFLVVDTGGLDEAPTHTLQGRMRRLTEKVVASADAVLFVIDARAGVTPLDRHFADLLRRWNRPVVVVANKCEGRAGETGRLEAYGLGFGEPVALSAEHGTGLADLAVALEEKLPHSAVVEDREGGEEGTEAHALQLAIVGRPNVGKSTLANRLLGEERLLTGPDPGVTRDAVPVDWSWRGMPVRLVDTAGLRRKSRVTARLEEMSVAGALRAIRLAEVVIVVLDATQGVDRQDLAICRHVVEEGRALVIAVNKSDALDNPTRALKDIRARLSRSLAQAKGMAVVLLSALTGEGVDALMPAAFHAYEIWNRRLPTPRLNRWLAETVERHAPPAPGGRRLRLRYMTQIKSRPPTFALFVNKPRELPESYVRFLENELREAFDLPGVPLRLELRKGENPYVVKAGRRAGIERPQPRRPAGYR